MSVKNTSVGNVVKRVESIGSERELDDIENLHSLTSLNFKQKLKEELPGNMSKFTDSYNQPGGHKPPIPPQGSSSFRNDGANPSTSTDTNPEPRGGIQWTFDLSEGREIPRDEFERQGHKSKLPRLRKEESASEFRSSRYPNEQTNEGIEMLKTSNEEYPNSEMIEGKPKRRKKSKKHSREPVSEEEVFDGEHQPKKHKKKKKSKHHGEESVGSTATYTVEDFERQGVSLPPHPVKKDKDTVSIGSNETYTVNHDEESDPCEESGVDLKASLKSIFQKMKTVRLSENNASTPKVSHKVLWNQKQTAEFISDRIKQRECSRYVRDHESSVEDCQCGRSKDWHLKKNIDVKTDKGKEIWNPKTHTKRFPCDSFGEITFRGFGHDATNSPYVRLEPNSNLDDVWEILLTHWGLPVPKLLISVTGGAKKFELKARLKTVLKQGLIHAANSTGAWIVTGGTAAGVMQFVGEAVRDHIFSTGNPEQNRVVALGIAPWGIIKNNLALDGEGDKGIFPAVYAVEDVAEEGEGAPLDHNHTHFLLVDNGTEGKFGGEISFRSEVESFISKKVETGVAASQSVHVPCVLLVVEGGVNTLKTVLETLRRGNPVVVIAGSGRCADLIAYGFKITRVKNNEEKTRSNDEIDEMLKDKGRVLCFDGKNTDSVNKQLLELIKNLKECLQKRRLLNVFNLERADVKEIDRAILYALLKANKSNADSQLALALAWNRSDIARQEIFTTENRSKWNPRTLYDAMVTALAQDRADFVQVFLDNGVDFKKFLTRETLWNLYCLNTSDFLDANGDVLRYLIGYTKQTWGAYFMCRGTKWENSHSLLSDVSKVLVHLMKDSAMDIYDGDKFNVNESCKPEMKWKGREETLRSLKTRMTQLDINQKQKTAGGAVKRKKNLKDVYDFNNPVRELFLWAVLFNRKKMAHLFWKLGQDQLGAALVACSLLKAMARVAENEEELELSADLTDNSEYFERLATNVLAECYRKDKKTAQQLLTREQRLWGERTLFEIANQNTLMNFLEHSCCQTKLNCVWMGSMALYTSQVKICFCIVLPILLPFIKFSSHKSLEDIIDDDEEEEEEEITDVNEENSKTDVSRPASGNRIAPVESPESPERFAKSKSRREKKLKKKRVYAVDYFKCNRENVNIVSAIVFFYSAPVTKFFTGLIAYLCFLAIFTYFVLIDLRPADEPDSPSVIEYITWGWLATMIIEELRQIMVLDQPPVYKLRNWFSSVWNRFDFAMYGMFIVSVVLRYTIFTSDFLWARMSYSITLAMFYLRLMQSFFISKNMGPKIIMIERMLTDLMFFFLILLVFILSFGIAYQANLYPNSTPDWVVLKNILYLPYWQMYGELFLERVEGDDDPEGCTRNESIWKHDLSKRCPDVNAIVPILLAVYMILTNILLVNLLIAMFSYTFQTIQDNSLKVWRFYRLGLVTELFDRPALVPPLVILNHMYRLFMYIINSTCGDFNTKNDFKEKLNNEEYLRMSLFEKGAMENHLSYSLMREREMLDNKVTSTALRLEMVMDELAQIKDTITEHDTISNQLSITAPVANTAELVPPKLSARSSNDEMSYLRHCVDDLAEQMGNNTSKLNSMMHMLENMLKRQGSRKMMDIHVEEA